MDPEEVVAREGATATIRAFLIRGLVHSGSAFDHQFDHQHAARTDKAQPRGGGGGKARGGAGGRGLRRWGHGDAMARVRKRELGLLGGFLLRMDEVAALPLVSLTWRVTSHAPT